MRTLVLALAVLGCAACRKPDLTIDSGPIHVDLAGTGVPGGSLRLSPWRMTNRGRGAARSGGGAIASSYRLSTDPAVTKDDRLLTGGAGLDLGELGPGQSYQFPGDQQIAIPADVEPGTYYFGVVVDSGDVVEESDETNNVASVRIGIVKRPD